MKIHEKLMKIQSDLKAPKNQYNSFGKYNYRSCEDILEGVKPLLQRENCSLTISDRIEAIGTRFYIVATATLFDAETGETISNTSYAREPDEKKGMDVSQVTGTASSYARKYALNGLFCIDDTKDADTDEYKNQQNNSKQKTNKNQSEPVQNQNQSEPTPKYICTVCGNEVKGLKKQDGTTMSAETAYEKCGNKCLKCYQQANSGGNQ